MFLAFGGATCLAVAAAFIRGAIGGFIVAALYHVALLICGAARGGFQTTYRVIAFGSGSVYILLPIPIVGMQVGAVVAEPILRLLLLGIPLAALLFVVAMYFIVLIYGFRNGHAISGPRAFAATLVAMFLYGLLIVGVMVLVFMALAALGAKLNLFPPRP